MFPTQNWLTVSLNHCSFEINLNSRHNLTQKETISFDDSYKRPQLLPYISLLLYHWRQGKDMAFQGSIVEEL
jgi:hypothetical protein